MHPYLYFNLRKWYHIASCFQYSSFLRSGCVNASLIAQMPAMQETPFQFLCGDNPPEKGWAAYSSILAWRIPWTEEPGKLQSMGSQRLGHNWATKHTTASSVYLTEGWIVLVKWWIRNAPCTWEGCWTRTYMRTHTHSCTYTRPHAEVWPPRILVTSW